MGIRQCGLRQYVRHAKLQPGGTGAAVFTCGVTSHFVVLNCLLIYRYCFMCLIIGTNFVNSVYMYLIVLWYFYDFPVVLYWFSTSAFQHPLVVLSTSNVNNGYFQ